MGIVETGFERLYGRHVNGPPTRITFTIHNTTITPRTAVIILLVIAFSGRARISHAPSHATAKIISMPITDDISVYLDLAPTM